MDLTASYGMKRKALFGKKDAVFSEKCGEIEGKSLLLQSLLQETVVNGLPGLEKS